MAKHIKQKIASAIHMSKNQSFLDRAYIGLRALILIIPFWEILFESGQLVGQKPGRKHHDQKPLEILYSFANYLEFRGMEVTLRVSQLVKHIVLESPCSKN